MESLSPSRNRDIGFSRAQLPDLGYRSSGAPTLRLTHGIDKAARRNKWTTTET
jgi:hypothetical protein